MSDATPILEVRGLAKEYPGVRALDGVDFDVRAGEVPLSKDGGLYQATFLYNPSMSASAIRMARLIVRGQGFDELTEPEVPSKITVPATTVTKDNVDDVMELGFQPRR